MLSAIVVTSTGDDIFPDGAVTLREAIASLNGGADINADVAASGVYGTNDTISFNIAGSSVQTILSESALPTIVKPVAIDGYSQPGTQMNTLATSDNAVLLIELNGSLTGIGANGLVFGAGSDGSSVSGLVINSFDGAGILVQSDGNSITGNFLGTNAAGTGSASISGGFGIGIEASSRTTIGGTTAAARNVIGGNSDGVNLGSGTQGTVIQGNFIGVGVDGTTAVGNRLHGIALQGNGEVAVQNNAIGGIQAGAGNIIANNGAAGVAVFGNPLAIRQNSGNTILGNSIYSNGLNSPATLPGIDLVGSSAYPIDDGITLNDLLDADSGPNLLQNTPVLTSATSSLVSTTIVGSLSSAANSTYRIEFFSNPTVVGVDFGQGQTFLGFADVTTDDNGLASFTAIVATTVPNGHFVTATATSGGNSTGTTPSGVNPSILGSAESFAVLAGSTITVTGPTTFIGDVGLSPGSAVNGTFTTTGTVHIADGIAVQAQVDLTAAYNALAGLAPTTDLTGQDLGNRTLFPGVYHFDTSAQLTGTLTLDTLGDPHAAFVFQIGSTLTTSVGASVVVLGGPDDSIFWQVGSSATIGVGTAFVGNIVAFTSITLETGASLASGRALARNGAVTLDSIFADSTTASQNNTSEFSAAIQTAIPTISINDVTLVEGDSSTTNAVFTVTLSEISDQTVTVMVASAAGTATLGADFVALPPTLVTFAPGERTQTVTVPVVGDTQVEGTETFFVNLTSASNALISDSQGLGTITDNDTNTLTISSPTVVEGNAGPTTMTFTVTSPAAVEGGFTAAFNLANITTDGADYTVVTTSPLIFAGTAGETHTITVTATGDTTVEGTETFTVTLGTIIPVEPVVASSIISGAVGTGTITNDDTNTLTISSPTVVEGNVGPTTMTFTVTSPAAVAGGFTVAFNLVDLTTNGADYTVVTTSPLTFAGTVGETHVVTVTVNGDVIVEGNETFTLTLGTVVPVNPVAAASIISGAVGTGTITNDDTNTLTISSPTVVEGNVGPTTMTFTVTSSAAVVGGFTVAFSFVDLTTNGADYTVVTTSPLTFAGTVGETHVVTVTVNGDVLVEGNETFTLTLGTVVPVIPVAAASIISGAVGTGTITNDDTNMLTISSPTVVEGNVGPTTMTFTVTSPGAVAGGFTVAFTVADITTNAADYVLVTSSPLIFSGTVGETHTIIVTANGDFVPEGNETFSVTLGAITPVAPVLAASIISGAVGTGTITNDDTNTLTISSPTVVEGNVGPTTMTFTVASPVAIPGGFTVAFVVADITTDGADYTVVTTGPLNFSGTAGETQTITITVNGDVLPEVDETFSVTLGTVVAVDPVVTASIISGAVGTGTITNDDTNTLTISSPTVLEGNAGPTTMTFTVTSPVTVAGGFTVAFSTADISANGSDYTIITTSPLTFAGTAGETQTITVTVNGDTIVEGNETFSVTLGTVTPLEGVGFESGAVGTGTITNDDTNTLTISSPTVVEGNVGPTTMTFTVTSPQAVAGGFSVPFNVTDITTNGADYTLVSSSPLIFSGTVGETQTITVTVNGDTVVEGNETFAVTLGTATPVAPVAVISIISDAVGTGTITNDDTNTLTISSPTVMEGNAGPTTMTFTITSPVAVDGGFTVAFNVADLTANGADYTVLTSSPLIFTGTVGETHTITVTVNGDTVVEADETFTVTLGTVTPVAPVVAASIISGAVGTGTITNDDTNTLTISSPTVVEGNVGPTTMTFTVTSPAVVEGGFTAAFNVADLSTSGADYTVVSTSPLVFLGTAGETQTITVTVNGDTTVEGNEAFTVTLGTIIPVAPVAAASIISGAVGTGTITNDDTNTLTISSPTVVEGNVGPTTMTFTVTSPEAVAGGFTVAFNLVDLTTNNADYTVVTTSPLIFLGTAGETQTITVTVNGDTLVEGNETFSVTLGTIIPVAPVVAASIISGAVGTGTITNDDLATVSITKITDGAEAGTPTNGQFRVTQSAVSATATVIQYSILGTATPDSDYAALTGTVTILAGQTFADINVVVIDDTIIETTETVIATLTGFGVHDPAITFDLTPANLTATVNITDNDAAFLPPDITSPATASVAENTPPATVILDVNATPVVAQTFTYTLSGVDAGLFNINSATGEITFVTSPNFEAPTDQGANNIYDVTVTVTADTIPAGSTAQALTITVTPVNDLDPIFIDGSPTFSIAEDSAVGTAVGAVAATDGDLPAQTLTYSIVSGNDSGAFAINPATGEITVANSVPLDFEVTTVFTLNVRVTDSVNPVRSADAVVVVNVTDVQGGPTIMIPHAHGIFHMGRIPAFVSPDSTFTYNDVANPDYSNATLTASIVTNRDRKDRLNIYPYGPGEDRISLKGRKVFFDGQQIGTFSGGRGNRHPDLVVKFNSNTTTSAVDNLMRRLNFHVDTSIGVTRTVNIQITNIGGVDSNLATRDIAVIDIRN